MFLRQTNPLALSLLLLACTGAPVLASSPSAWEEFRRDVEASCREAAVPLLTEPQIVVDPFGLQSYGLAFLSGNAVEDGTPQSLVCVYDKVARTVEIGGALALESTVPALRQDLAAQASATADAAPAGAGAGVPDRLLSPTTLAAPAPLAPAPASAATLDTALLDTLTAEDRAALEGLPAQIERTIAANAGASLGTAVAAVRDGAARAADAARGEGSAPAAPGSDFVGAGSCTLYYFGFSGEAARTVGTHQCRVLEGETGALVVEKTSGERLRAELRPGPGGVTAFAGRTFEAGASLQAYDRETPQDPASSELGNVVGLAAQSEDRLLLVSSQLRRFDPSDSFFWVLAMDRP